MNNISLYKYISKLWTPIFIGEGEIIPKWYGITRWIPDPSIHNPEIYRWKKVAYPLPTKIVLTAYWWIFYKMKWGWKLPPSCYRSQTFMIIEECPHCHKNIYEEALPQ